MKKIILFLLTALMLSAAQAVSAEQLAFFNTSSAGSVEGTGFGIGKPIPDDAVYKIVADSDGNQSLFMSGSADTSKTICFYDQSWSSKTVDHLLMKTRVKTDEISGASKEISFRMSQAPHCIAMNINNSRFYCCGKEVKGVTVEPGRWYDIQIALKKYPSYLVEMYIDGEKAASEPFANLVYMTADALQFRVEVTGGFGTLYVGDTEIYVPDAPRAELEREQLSSVDEPVGIALVSSETDMTTAVKENITVTDNMSGEQIDFDLGQTDKGIELTFPGGIRKDNSYTVSLENVLDKSGQRFNSITFLTPAPDSDYTVGSARLYSGFDTADEISSLRAGDITVAVSAANGGIQPRSAELICVLYQDSKLVGMSIAGLELGEEEQSELYTSIHLDKADAGTKLYVMVWDRFCGTPVTGKTVFSG